MASDLTVDEDLDITSESDDILKLLHGDSPEKFNFYGSFVDEDESSSELSNEEVVSLS